MRAVRVTLPDGRSGRAYAAADVARALGVTPKTVVAWLDRDRPGGARFAGWAPHTVAPDDRRWLVDAGDVDAELARRRAATPPAGEIEAEQQRLAEERQLLELERSVFLRERSQQLEEENARLHSEVARLRAQLAVLGQVVRDLTVDSV